MRNKSLQFLLLILIVVTIIYLVLHTALSSSNQSTRSPKTAEIQTQNLIKNTDKINKPAKSHTDLRAAQQAENSDITQRQTSANADIRDCRHISPENLNEQLDEKLAKYQREIKTSDKPDDLLSSFIFQKDLTIEQKSALLEKISPSQHNNALTFKFALDLCINDLTLPLCNETTYQQAIIASNNNALFLTQLALIRIKEGNLTQSKYYLKQAAQKSMFTEYDQELAVFIDSNLTQNGTFTSTERLLLTLTGTAGAVSRLGDLSKHCLQQFDIDEDYLEICHSIGILLEDTAKTGIAKAIGIQMQIKVQEYWQQTEMVDMLTAKANQLFETLTSEDFAKAIALVLHDEKLLQDWLNLRSTQNEVFAAKALIDEAKFLSQNPDYNPCRAAN